MGTKITDLILRLKDRSHNETKYGQKSPFKNAPFRQGILVNVSPLAACVNYADLNYSMLRIFGHHSAGFYRCDILFLQGKHNGFRNIYFE